MLELPCESPTVLLFKKNQSLGPDFLMISRRTKWIAEYLNSSANQGRKISPLSQGAPRRSRPTFINHSWKWVQFYEKIPAMKFFNTRFSYTNS